MVLLILNKKRWHHHNSMLNRNELIPVCTLAYWFLHWPRTPIPYGPWVFLHASSTVYTTSVLKLPFFNNICKPEELIHGSKNTIIRMIIRKSWRTNVHTHCFTPHWSAEAIMFKHLFNMQTHPLIANKTTYVSLSDATASWRTGATNDDWCLTNEHKIGYMN